MDEGRERASQSWSRRVSRGCFLHKENGIGVEQAVEKQGLAVLSPATSFGHLLLYENQYGGRHGWCLVARREEEE